MNKPECLFCDLANSEQHKIIEENALAYARWDNQPVTEGHAEIVPKRHVESYFDLEQNEVLAMHGLAVVVRDLVVARFKPDGFTIGVNDGEAAGMTIDHLHMHIIPRYLEDANDSRKGVRSVTRK